VDLGKKKSIFLGKFPNILIFSGNFTQTIQFFLGKLSENFYLFRQFHKNFDFPGKNWSFTATSGQIILFLFKSHHF